MKKSLTASLFVTIILTVAAMTAMYFIPLPASTTDSSPDSLTTTSYGFPFVFKTTQSGGIAGNLPAKETVNSAYLAFNSGLVAIVLFGLTFGAISLANRHKS